MKRWMKIVLGVVVVIVLAVAGGLYFTSGIVDTANDFFKAVQQKDMVKARGYLAEELKASADERTLAAFLARNALTSVKDTSWSSREVSGGKGELTGTVTTETGGTVPLKLIFVKEKDAWKIYAIQKPAAGLQTDKPSSTAAAAIATIPGKAEQIALIKQSTYNFVASATMKDMGHFRSTVSNLWQQQFTTEQLNQSYKAVMDSGANWLALNNLDPILTSEASVDGNGVLVLNAYYPTTPTRVHVVQKFVNEGGAWKLIGFHLQTKRD